MDTLYKYVKAQLERRKKQITKVAVDNDVSARTLYHILHDKDVMHGTLVKLHDYLKAHARKSEL